MTKNYKLNEGLRSGDLKDYVSEIFTIDRYKSKMGEDRDIVVMAFRVREKFPAVDLMEFIEKGYDFILDADMSAGEENDGKYQVFVEIERTPKLKEQIKELLGGVSQLCDCSDWRFRYQTSEHSVEYNENTIIENVPLTPDEYATKMVEIKGNDVRQFFDQGAVNVELDEANNITFKKPYAGNIDAKFIAIGPYEAVKELMPGPLSLDEGSQSQLFFLTKYLGNYDINKINNKFLIRNGDQAVIIEKSRW